MAGRERSSAAAGENRTARPRQSPFAPQVLDYADPDPLLGMVDARRSISLNGEWRLVVDPMGVGDPGAFFGGFPRNKRNEDGMSLVEYDLEASQRIRVPGDFNTQDDRLFFYQGRVWYFRTFPVEKVPAGSRRHLWFGGVNFAAHVFLNGKPVGQHLGGYVPFSFDITDELRAGDNELLVRVDNSLTADTVPALRTDWWPYGGLTRDVMLVETPAAFIRNAKVTLLDLASRTLEVSIETEGVAQGAPAEVRIPELNVVRTMTVAADGTASDTFTADVELWAPDHPRRYAVVFSAGDDEIEETIGFRTIGTQGQSILLNGERVKLHGISTHEEPIGEPGVAYSEDHVRRLLEEARALNVNFVRAAHYPYSRHMARVADELGIMLWEEVPVYWNIAWENAGTLAIARDQIARLVQRDWNRASVVIWSVANETPLSEPRMEFLGRLLADVRALDPSRLVTAALLGGGGRQFAQVMAHLAARGLARGDLDEEVATIFEGVLDRAGADAPSAEDGFTIVIDDPLGELVDVVAYNEYYGWYYAAMFADRLGVGEDVLRPLELEFMRDVRITASVDKPVHVSEFGAEAQAGRRGGEALLWTEEYQADVYRAQLAMLGASPQVQGITPWILKDFRAMLRTLPGIQDYFNRKGLIDDSGQRKLAFDVLREFYEGPWPTSS